ncbi:hypothetical protein Nepgr_003955 [Nepenthes gracilis]|uniref:Uncharacterized protein n=1 Tax=Nepenthes gracilis TaxID=150966 RepID=A0AAD3XEP4_NEPGR|nr:hypothetical protein Nepgr_003955 [Nepenthes gracilis]
MHSSIINREGKKELDRDSSAWIGMAKGVHGCCMKGMINMGVRRARFLFDIVWWTSENGGFALRVAHWWLASKVCFLDNIMTFGGRLCLDKGTIRKQERGWAGCGGLEKIISRALGY